LTVERQKQVRALFDAALDQPADLRSEFLAHACDGDQQLVLTVEKLLRAHERSAGILDTPIHDRHDTPPVERAPGTFIGAYKILQELPGGGMGVVYQAIRADEVFQRVCAVKVIRAELSNNWMLERFRKERQILAQLDHAHIARIVDGGSTPDALPYFVMDYVDGPSIDKYCKQQKLKNRERLRLFQQACAAVHYAHHKGVIHGDLKPPNILVGNDGVVKLVDFGIATVVASSQDKAENDAMPLMTPGYASPEQLRSDPLTPTSDVYSLGVILYELLSGTRPFITEGRSRSEVLNAIATVNPAPPSEAVKTSPDASSQTASPEGLKGDLDWVILKAVHRDPAERYQTPAEFSEDLTRYLQKRPVVAAKKGMLYKGTKLVFRHQRAAIAACVIAVLFVALAWQGWELRERYQQSMRFQDQIKELQAQQVESLRELESRVTIPAEGAAPPDLDMKQLQRKQLNETRKLANAYRTSFSESVRLWPGMTHTRRNLLDQADQYLRQAEPLLSEDPESPEDLATAWLWLANIEGNPQTINLHDTVGAKISIDEAARLIENAPDASAQLRDQVLAAAQQIAGSQD
jgi:hypothetical protein